MTFLPVVGRELRAESRRPFNYWLRVIGVAALLGACLLAVYFQSQVDDALARMQSRLARGWGGPGLPAAISPNTVFGTMLFGYTNATVFVTLAILVPLLTADCVSREKREGTLGLLFLTPLTAGGVVVGKSFVHGLRALSLYLTMAPMLAVPVLFGGVSAQDVAMAALVDACVLVLALAAGLLASCLARDTVRAVLLAEVFSLAFVGAFMWMHCRVMAAITSLGQATGPRAWVPWSLWRGGNPVFGAGLLSDFVTLFVFNTNLVLDDPDSFAFGGTGAMAPWAGIWSAGIPGTATTWFFGVGLLLATSCGVLGLVILWASRWVRAAWREEPASERATKVKRTFLEQRFWRGLFRRKMRRALERNPAGWLQQYSVAARLTKWGWCVFVLLAECVLATAWTELVPGQKHLFLALGAGLAFAAASSFREERESGALELLLVTPLSVPRIIWGRLCGVWMQFLPSVAVLLGAWGYAKKNIPGWSRWQSDAVSLDLGWPVAATFVVLPVVGLYFSLTRLALPGRWLLTCAVGGVLPWLLAAWFLELHGNRHFGSLNSFDLLCCQAVVAAGFTALLYVRLARRQFAWER